MKLMGEGREGRTAVGGRARRGAAVLAALALLLLVGAGTSHAAWSPPSTASDGPVVGYDIAEAVADENGRATVAWPQAGVIRSRSYGDGGAEAVRTATPLLAEAETVGNPVLATSPTGHTALAYDRCRQEGDYAFAYTVCTIEIVTRGIGATSWSEPVKVFDPNEDGLGTNCSPSVQYRVSCTAGVQLAVDDEGDVTIAYTRGYSYYKSESEPNAAARVARVARVSDGVATSLTTIDEWSTFYWYYVSGVAVDANGRAAVAITRSKQSPDGGYSEDNCDDTALVVRELAGGISWSAPRELLPCDADMVDTDDAQWVPAVLRDGGAITAVAVAQDGPAEPDEGTYAVGVDAAGAPGTPRRLTSAVLSSVGAASAGQHAAIAGLNESLQPVLLAREAGTWAGAHVADGPEGRHDIGVAVSQAGDVTAVWLDAEGIAAAARPAGGAWSNREAIESSEAGARSRVSAVATASGPRAFWGWTEGDSMTGEVRSSLRSGSVPQRPTASFTFSPRTPTAGEVVTFTSTSSDDGTIASQRWDLDDDGDFDDGSANSAAAVFEPAGTYRVELEVTDDEGRTDSVIREVVVAAKVATSPGKTTPDTATPGTSPETTTPGTTTPGSGSPGPQQPPPPASLPAGFVPVQVVQTDGRRKVPNVVGRPLDSATDKVRGGLKWVTVRELARSGDEADLPKRPGGGAWRIGDVVSQTPAAGKVLSTSVVNEAAVTLTYWSGARGDRSRCADLRKAVRGDDLQAGLEQLRAARCKAPDIEMKPSKSVGDVVVKQAAKDGDVVVKVPTRPDRLDLTIWKNHGAVGTDSIGPEKGTFSLTAGQPNVAGIVVRDRAGRLVSGATVRVDSHEVSGKDLRTTTNGNGVAPFGIKPKKAGTVHVLVELPDKAGERLYGYAPFDVIDRCSKQASFESIIGEIWTRTSGKDCRYVRTKRTARPAAVGDWFGFIAEAMRGLGANVAQTVAAGREGLIAAGKKLQAGAMQLANGIKAGQARLAELQRVSTGLWSITANGVVSAGGGNVVSAGGANVVSAGGANVVAAGGMNLIAGKGGRILSDNGLGVIAAGGGNIFRLPDGSGVVSAGGGNVVSAGGGNVVAAGGMN